MQVIYEAHTGLNREDFADQAEARRTVENHGSGYIVTFVRGYDKRDRSCAMNVWRDSKWQGVDICGAGVTYGKEVDWDHKGRT